MSKAYLFLIVAITVVLGISLGSLYYLHHSAGEISETFPALEQSIINEDWNEAQIYFTQSRTSWENHNRYWPLLVSHNKVSTIDKAFNSLHEALYSKNSINSHLELTQLTYLVEEVPREEKPICQNIF
ncbi:MAG: DUF4363 family protein [Bacillota bacterium]|jgi:hypothetical protein